MELRRNKSFRNLGVYTLSDKTLILLKRSEFLSFLFSLQNWNLHGPVDYRVSHGNIYYHGQRTQFTDEDLLDTGTTAKQPTLSILLNGAEG
jgi:hypothetical protein